MATENTTTFGSLPVVSTISLADKIVTVDPSGGVSTINAARFASAISGTDNFIDALFPNVRIAFPGGTSILLDKLSSWPYRQSSGAMAVGVAVMVGNKILIVAPSSATVPFSSGNITTGATVAASVAEAHSDLAGKTNTAAAISASTSAAITDTAAYAPGYCNLYSRVDSSGRGIGAGKWWLPSMGELLIILSNLPGVNYAMSLITGGSQVGSGAYWSSTDRDNQKTWRFYFDGNTYAGNKTTERNVALPVTTLQ